MASSSSSSFLSPLQIPKPKPVLLPRHPTRIRNPIAPPSVFAPRSVQTDPKPASPSPSPSEPDTIQRLLKRDYKWGFNSDFESFSIPKGLSESTIRSISGLKSEPEWMLRFRLDAFARFLTMKEPTWSDNSYPSIDFDSITYYSEPKRKPKLDSLDEGRPGARPLLRAPRRPHQRAEAPRQRRGRRRHRLHLHRHHPPRDPPEGRRHLLLHLRGRPGVPGPRQEVPGEGRPAGGQLLRRPQLRRLQRRLLLLRAQGHRLADGDLDLLPDQRQGERAVREDPHHRRGRELRQLLGRLHRAELRQEPAARRGGRAALRGARRDPVLDGAELVRGRRGGAGRDLQLRDEEGALRGGEGEDLVDAGGDGVGDHVEVPERGAEGGRVGGGVLLGGAHEGLPAGRHRDEDDTPGEGHEEQDRVEGDIGGEVQELLPGARAGDAQGYRGKELLAVRFDAYWGQGRSQHLSIYTGQERNSSCRARGEHV
ncbi:putative UPF0051 protein [Iris pallida]|uniref:UPF0051 protein n=1 Tax=Iris pallida TaxID=29817 RepID=A0AAX6GQT7_IRIPA|nr:putative UPF0051 protein [Iris pallida]